MYAALNSCVDATNTLSIQRLLCARTSSSRATLLLAQVALLSATFCDSLDSVGWISLGTIVHPKATIFAIAGPIVIGSGCIIEEGAIIVNRCVAP